MIVMKAIYPLVESPHAISFWQSQFINHQFFPCHFNTLIAPAVRPIAQNARNPFHDWRIFVRIAARI